MNVNKLLVSVAFSMFFGSGVAMAAADFDKGMNAYDSGDYKAALAEWTPLAEQGLAKAQYNLARLYYNSYGVPQNHKTALKWYTLAAEQGYSDAQYNLAHMYADGEGVPENDKTAVKWFTLAAEQGDAMAQYNLGVMYDEGEGVPENNKTAVQWYTLAAEQGDVEAQYNLAYMFRDGEGVLENNKTAYRWAKLAAAQGNAEAQGFLGELAMNDEDWIRSYMWFNLAAYNGAEAYNDYFTISEMKEYTKDEMTPADVDMAQQMASRCLESGYTDCWMMVD